MAVDRLDGLLVPRRRAMIWEAAARTQTGCWLAASSRERNIQKHDIKFMSKNFLHCLRAVPGFIDNSHVCVFQENLFYTFPRHAMIVNK